MEFTRLSKFAWLLLPWTLTGQGETAGKTVSPEADQAVTGRILQPIGSALPGQGQGTALAKPDAARGGAGGAVTKTAPAAQESIPDKMDQPVATPVIKSLNQALLEAMRRAKELGYAGRYRLLEPVVRQAYDFHAISRYVLGPYWKRLTPEQKALFIEKMTRYGIATYAAQFDDYGGERFEILEEKPFRGRFRVVKTVLRVPNDEDVQFVFVLRRTKDGWKIIDVRYDGISDLALKRGQFTEILEKDGFEALLAKLEEKIADYATESEAKTS